MAAHFSKIDEIVNQLKQLGEAVSDKMVITKILMSLPDDFKHFISAWESVSEDKQKIENLLARLLVEEERLKNTEKPVALVSRVKCFKCGKEGHFQNICRQNRKDDDRHKNKRCNYCKKLGRIAEFCRHRIAKEKEKNKDNRNDKGNGNDKNKDDNKSNNKNDHKNEKNVNAFIVTAMCGTMFGNHWVIDSAASEHLCFNKGLFVEYQELRDKISVLVGDGRVINAVGIGIVKVLSCDGNTVKRTTINNVLFVPELTSNLFSVTSAMSRGYKVDADIQQWRFVKNNQTCAIGKRQCKLFVMEFKNPSELVTANRFI